MIGWNADFGPGYGLARRGFDVWVFWIVSYLTIEEWKKEKRGRRCRRGWLRLTIEDNDGHVLYENTRFGFRVGAM
ncbi:hypothetical protein M8R20_18220 [Pseudomonas sp. R2.Fl]|nr:hypothetical protein [Pseudomonas sp. R2.Fl]